MNSIVQVSCAVIINQHNKVLAVQRSEKMSMPLKWEFPGGKIEVDESPEDALIREIHEELDVQIEIINSLTPTSHDYDKFQIRLLPFLAKITSGTIVLKEHNNMLWIKQSELRALDWAKADIPIVKEIMDLI